MKIRAWISLRIGKTSNDSKHAGDVLCVKLQDSPVGDREWKEFLIVDDWQDSELESRLVAMREAGEPHPVITHPYAEYLSPDEYGHREIITRSTKRVNLDALPDKASVLDKSREKTVRQAKDLSIVEVTK